MKGTYALLMKLINNSKIRIGSLGLIHFPKGNYLYIGSALNGIEGRVIRHLSDSKKIHWHIDYLLEKAEVFKVYFLESRKKTECSIADKFFEKFDPVPRFGSSDCNCTGHLFYGNRNELVDCALKSGMKELDIIWEKN